LRSAHRPAPGVTQVWQKLLLVSPTEVRGKNTPEYCGSSASEEPVPSEATNLYLVRVPCDEFGPASFEAFADIWHDFFVAVVAQL